MGVPLQLLGKAFGRLTVIKQLTNNSRGTVWECRCECGLHKGINGERLTKGTTSSCGCLRREIHAERCRTVLPEINRHKTGEALRKVVLSGYKHRASKRGYEWALTEEQATTLLLGNCEYCGVPPCLVKSKNGKKNYNGSFTHNGIDRVNNSLGYTSSNVVSCCHVCNMAKRTTSAEDFISWAARVTAHQASKVA